MPRKRTVLVIEDDVAIQALVDSMLRYEGYDVVCANNGLEGLQLLDRVDPDVILLDIGMPVMNGEEFIEEFYHRPAPHIPIVATSAYTVNPKTIAGLAGFIKKPFDLYSLRQTLDDVMTLYSQA